MANEQTSVPLYAAAEVLTAANMNISAGTGVPVFATTVTRDAAFGGAGEKVLAEGQLCYLSASNIVQYYDGAAWATVGPTASKIAQVVQSTSATLTTSTSTSYVTTGLAVTITPTLNTSKILVMANTGGALGGASTIAVNFTLFRGTVAGTNLGSADGMMSLYASTVSMEGQVAPSFLDSPATTSATTYTLGMKTTSATCTVKAQMNSATGSITVMEVLA